MAHDSDNIQGVVGLEVSITLKHFELDNKCFGRGRNRMILMMMAIVATLATILIKIDIIK